MYGADTRNNIQYKQVNLIFMLCFSILYIGSFDVVKAGSYEEEQIL